MKMAGLVALVSLFMFIAVVGMLTMWTIVNVPVKPGAVKSQSYCTEARAKALEDRVTALEAWAQREGMKRK